MIKQIDFIAFFVDCLFQVLKLTRDSINYVSLRIHLFLTEHEKKHIQCNVKGDETKIFHTGQHRNEHKGQNQILNELDDLFPPLLSPNAIEESIRNVLFVGNDQSYVFNRGD